VTIQFHVLRTLPRGTDPLVPIWKEVGRGKEDSMHQPRPEPLSSKSPYRLSYRFMHAQLSCQQKSTTSRLYSVSVLFFIRKMETVNKRSLLLTAFFLREVLNPVRSWPDFVFSILLSFYPRHKERLSWIQSVFLSSSNFV